MKKKLSLNNANKNFLKTLPLKQYRQIINSIFDLCDNPVPQDSKKMCGSKSHKRIDIGQYRIIYRFDQDTVYIVTIGKRNDDQVYKIFQRL